MRWDGLAWRWVRRRARTSQGLCVCDAAKRCAALLAGAWQAAELQAALLLPARWAARLLPACLNLWLWHSCLLAMRCCSKLKRSLASQAAPCPAQLWQAHSCGLPFCASLFMNMMGCMLLAMGSCYLGGWPCFQHAARHILVCIEGCVLPFSGHGFVSGRHAACSMHLSIGEAVGEALVLQSCLVHVPESAGEARGDWPDKNCAARGLGVAFLCCMWGL